MSSCGICLEKIYNVGTPHCPHKKLGSSLYAGQKATVLAEDSETDWIQVGKGER